MVAKSRVKIRRENNPSGGDDNEGGELQPSTDTEENNLNGGDPHHPNTEGIEGFDNQPSEPIEYEGNTVSIRGRRGRPPGAKNKPKQNTTAGVFEEPIKQPTQTPKSTRKKKKVMSGEDAVQITTTLLTITETFAVSLVGEEGRINETEKMLLYSSVPPMLESVSLDAVESVNKILYPATALIALGMYSIRLFQVYSTQKTTQQETNFVSSQRAVNTVTSEPPLTTEFSSNGNGDNKDIWMKPDLTHLQREF